MEGFITSLTENYQFWIEGSKITIQTVSGEGPFVCKDDEYTLSGAYRWKYDTSS